MYDEIPYSLKLANSILLNPEVELSDHKFKSDYRGMPSSKEDIIGKKVLDAGCGSGIDLIRASFFGSDAVGMDLSLGSLNLLNKMVKKSGFKSLSLINADIENAPFRNGVFDTIMCYGVLHHTKHTEKGLAELAKACKNGGTLYLMLYNKYSLWAYVKIFLRLLCRRSRILASILRLLPPFRDKTTFNDNFTNPIAKQFSVKEIRLICQPIGLRIEKIEIMGLPLLHTIPLKIARHVYPLLHSYGSKYGFLVYMKLRLAN